MSKSNKPDIVSRLEKHNTHDDRIKIRTREKTNGGLSVYFDIYLNGKRETDRVPKSLHLTGTQASLKEDKEKLALIVAMRDQKQNELLKNETGFTLSDDSGKDFMLYFEQKAKTKDHNWTTCIKHLKTFINGKKLTFGNINYSFCSKFAEYLQSVVGQNTSIMFFQKFKSTLNLAIKEDIIAKNPAQNISIKKKDTKREFLHIHEVEKLIATPKTNFDTCNAFLFSCFTGLRFSDIKNLRFDQIRDGYIEFKQQKTGSNERFKLSSSALVIIKAMSEFKRSELVFPLHILNSVEIQLKKWIKAAEIDKHITFHCGRHTFATMALTRGVDIFTVSKLLGHRDISTTMIYAKLIDSKKDEAIDKMPEFSI